MSRNKNPYIGSKGNFNYRKWLKDAQGQLSLSKKFIGYAESQGYRIGWDRDSMAMFEDRYGGANEVGTFRLRNANYMKGGVAFRPEVGLYRIGDADSSGGGGSGSRGSGGSGSSGSGGFTPQDYFQAVSQASTAGTRQAMKSIDKLIRQMRKGNKGPDVDKIRSSITKELQGDYDTQMANMRSLFTSQLESMRGQAARASEGYQAQLAAANRRMQDMRSLFTSQLEESQAARAELQEAFEQQSKQTLALRTAFVPELERSAAAPQFADTRSEQQRRRPTAQNSLSELSLATTAPGSGPGMNSTFSIA